MGSSLRFFTSNMIPLFPLLKSIGCDTVSVVPVGYLPMQSTS